MQRQAYFEEDDQGEEGEAEGGRRREGERIGREWDPDADASETKEGRGERKYRFTARKSEGSIKQGAFTPREL